MSDEEVEFIYDDDDEEDTIAFESSIGFTKPHDDALNLAKTKSIMSQGSEFEIDEDFSGEDFEYDELLSVPLSHNGKKTLNDGSVPNLKYDCLTTQDIFEKMLARIHRLQPVLSIPPEDILTLIQHYDWNEERLLEAWTDKMDDLLVELGINTNHLDNPQRREVVYKTDFSCPICCEEKSTETFALECGHEYCIDCYKHYIRDKLHKGNVITCMSCSLALRNDDIDKVMGTAFSAKLMDSSIKSFVQKHNRNYKWCPFADCKCIIYLKDLSLWPEYSRLHYSPFVECNSKHRFCFNCSFEVHAPADCKVTNAWVKKARKESENLNWVLSHTKECPECSVNIEKSGGCNHMICSSCKHEFCWICEGAWAPHGKNFFQCSMYKNEDSKNKNADENSRNLKKYTFYYRVFNEHEVSAKLDWTLGQTMGHKVKDLQEKVGISWIEGQFLAEALKTLNEGRTALKWSFALAYYADPSHNMTKIFVDNQGLLSSAVEDLSELLQIKEADVIIKRKPEFYNKAGYVENRTQALLECGRDLLCKGICKIT
ncbi:hypothetical protein RNJ44_02833 [Nakaseomyces bracarensis]|uniref:RBR-type E3 ubiquitin transferase n=1 Tax=Nakaseomyces bracarensis TaxID=273131 RepID=A0ABR4P0D7_9SACH